MNQGKPYWEMSRLSMEGMGRFDRLYKDQKKRILSSKAKARNNVVSSSYKPISIPKKVEYGQPKLKQKIDDIGEIELVGYKPSEYKAFRSQQPLRGRTAPSECGCRDIFKDCHTPIQVTKRFQGDPILSVPIRRTPVTSSLSKSSSLKKEKAKRDLPIHEVLFEESVEQRENLDPMGYSANETVNCPEITMHGIKLKVSRL